MTKRYNPNQPRVPAGNPNGGQWTSDGSIAEQHAREAAGLRPNRYRVIGDNRFVGDKIWGILPDGRLVVGDWEMQHRDLLRKFGFRGEGNYLVRGDTVKFGKSRLLGVYGLTDQNVERFKEYYNKIMNGLNIHSIDDVYISKDILWFEKYKDGE